MSNTSNQNNDTALPKPAIPSRRELIYGDKALAAAIRARLSTVRRWRSNRVIPHIKTGHKTVIYDLNKVLSALEALEVKPVTGKGAR